MNQKYLIIAGPADNGQEAMHPVPFTVEDGKIVISIDYLLENNYDLHMKDENQLKLYFSI